MLQRDVEINVRHQNTENHIRENVCWRAKRERNGRGQIIIVDGNAREMKLELREVDDNLV